MLVLLVGIALAFEILGWSFVGHSILANEQRLAITILEVSVVRGVTTSGFTYLKVGSYCQEIIKARSSSSRS